MSSNELEKATVSDDLTFRLTNSISEVGVFGKNSNDMHSIKVEVGSMHLKNSHYVVSLTNNYNERLTDIEIVDGDFDSRFYLSKMRFESTPQRLLQQMTIFGVDKNDQKHEITFSNPSQFFDIDQKTRDKVVNQANQIEEGLMDESEYVVPTNKYEKLVIEFDDDAYLEPGEVILFHVGMGFVDPYKVLVYEKPDDIELNKYINKANFTAKYKNTIVSADDDAEAKTIKVPESFVITKNTVLNPQTIDGTVRYNIVLNFSNVAANRRIRNAKLIDFLPVGLTFESYYPNLSGLSEYVDNIEVIDNYLESGKTAVIYHFKDFKPADVSQFNLNIYGKITSDMINNTMEDETHNNDNLAYFVSDSLNGVNSTSMLVDTYDVNQNNNREERVFGASSKTPVNLPEERRSEKLIKKSNTSWLKTGITTGHDENFEYMIRTINGTSATLNELMYVDVLPYQDDDRNSGYANQLRGPVIADSRFEVLYSYDVVADDQINSNINNNVLWLSATDVDDFSLVKSIFIKLKPGEVINGNEIIETIVPMVSPKTTDVKNIESFEAHNDFSVSYNGTSFGKSNKVTTYLNRNIPVSKTWVGLVGGAIRVDLYRLADKDNVIQSIVLNEANNYQGSFENIPVVDNNRQMITDYAISETLITPLTSGQYTQNITGSIDEGFTIINTYQPEKTDITVTKIWIGGSDEKPPIQIQLYRDGIAYGPVVTLASGETTYTWSDIAKTDIYGKPYVYTVDEINVPQDYVKIVNDFTIINSYDDIDRKNSVVPVDPEVPVPPQIPDIPTKQEGVVIPKTGVTNDTFVVATIMLVTGLVLLFVLVKKKSTVR